MRGLLDALAKALRHGAPLALLESPLRGRSLVAVRSFGIAPRESA